MIGILLSTACTIFIVLALGFAGFLTLRIWEGDGE